MLTTFTRGEKKLLKGLKTCLEIFPFYYDEEYDEQMKFEREIEEERRRRRKEKKEK